MNRKNDFRFIHILLVFFILSSFQLHAANLPDQAIVLVIDNSKSMEDTDPIRLRGIAASLILDAADLVSKLQAGIVFFSSTAEPVIPLDAPSKIKFYLQSAQLPIEDGGTNMQAALETAVSMLQASNAQEKKIILLTDGVPDNGQDSVIRNTLTTQMKTAGIKLFALGLSTNVDKIFLDEITASTGGMALVSEKHTELLKTSKKLLGDKENVFTLEDTHLQDNETEYSFEIPEGVDRARLTVILDKAQLFAPGQIDFDISGPGSVDSRPEPYRIKKDNTERVVAWSAFLSSPPKGQYTLKSTIDKPPFNGHKGATVLLEVRSDFDIQLILNPELDEYYVGEELEVDVFLSKSSGPVDPTLVNVAGRLDLPDGGTAPIAFSGIIGTFIVPDSPGRHTIHIEASTSGKLPPVIAEMSYKALQPEPAELRSSRNNIVFLQELGPEHLNVEESLKIFADFPDEGRYRNIKVTASLLAPHIYDLATLRDSDGTTIKLDGKKKFTIRKKEGLELILGFKYGEDLSFDKPLQINEPKYQGILQISSLEASDSLELPIEVKVRIPSLDLHHPTEQITLWWSPEPRYARAITLGNVTTDANQPSEFRVIVPSEDIAVTDGPKEAIERKIASWYLTADEEEKRKGDKSGEVIYGPYELSRSKYRLQATIKPDSGEHGAKSVKGRQKFSYELQSKFGVRLQQEVKLLTLPPPWWAPPYLSSLIAPISGYAQHILIWLTAFVLYFLIRPVKRLNWLRKYSSWRKTKIKSLTPGSISISGNGALVLPNISKAPITKIGTVSYRNEKLGIIGQSNKCLQLNGKIIANKPQQLKRKDVLTILDPSTKKPLWKLKYLRFDARKRVLLMKIQQSPIRDNLLRVLSGTIAAILVFMLIKHGLESEWAAKVAYNIPLLDTLYSIVF